MQLRCSVSETQADTWSETPRDVYSNVGCNLLLIAGDLDSIWQHLILAVRQLHRCKSSTGESGTLGTSQFSRGVGTGNRWPLSSGEEAVECTARQ